MAAVTRAFVLLAALCLPAFSNVPFSLAVKPHPGLADLAPVSHQAVAAANALIAPGIAGCLCDEGRRSRSTGTERDAETGLDYFGARYMSAAQGRFTSPDAPFADQNPENPQSWNLYQYGYNNPLANVDHDGRFVVRAVVTVAKLAYKGYDAYDTVTSLKANASTVLDSKASFGQRALAAADIALEVAGGFNSKDIRRGADAVAEAAGGLKRIAGKADDAAGAALHGGGKTFDQARREGFEKAGMTDPTDVKFSKVDPKTGTVVEFKGTGGAKVAYDGPHASPGPGHDSPHVGWQTGGKRTAGRTERGNIPYTAPQHPSRSPNKGEGVVDEH